MGNVVKIVRLHVLEDILRIKIRDAALKKNVSLTFSVVAKTLFVWDHYLHYFGCLYSLHWQADKQIKLSKEIGAHRREAI